MPSDITTSVQIYPDGAVVVNSLLNLMTLNVNETVLVEAESICLNLMGFLGGLSLSECDGLNTMNRNKSHFMAHRVMQRLPSSLRPKLTESLGTVIQSLGADRMGLIASRMLEWPQIEGVWQWILALLQRLEHDGMLLLCA